MLAFSEQLNTLQIAVAEGDAGLRASLAERLREACRIEPPGRQEVGRRRRLEQRRAVPVAGSEGPCETVSLQAKPATDKLGAYARHVYQIADETAAELSRIAEKQMSEASQQMFATIEEISKGAPAGTEGIATFYKSAVSAANLAWDQVNKGQQADRRADRGQCRPGHRCRSAGREASHDCLISAVDDQLTATVSGRRLTVDLQWTSCHFDGPNATPKLHEMLRPVHREPPDTAHGRVTRTRTCHDLHQLAGDCA